MDKKIKGKNLKYLIPFVFIVIYILIYILNVKSTFVADDFNNMFSYNERIKSIRQIIDSQLYRYYHTNGRVVAHFIGSFFLMFNKIFINFINSLGFCILIYFMYKFLYLDQKYILPKRRKKGKAIKGGYLKNNTYKILVVLGIFLMLWQFTPYFGQDFLWVIGSANYMWTAIIVLGAILVVRNISVFKKDVRSHLFLVLSIVLFLIAGSTNENTVPGFLLIILYYIVRMLRNKNKDIFFVILMFISALCGYLVMLTAPGNFVRAKSFVGDVDGIVKYTQRFSLMNEKFIKYYLIVLIIAILLTILARIVELDKSFESSVFILAGLGSYYAMVMSPTFPERAMLISLIFFVISMIMNLSIIANSNFYITLSILLVGVVVLGVMFVSSYSSANKALSDYKKAYNERAIVIWHNLDLGRKENIVVKKLNTKSTYVPAYNLEHCEKDPKHWINVTIARYYGVRSVVSE